MRRISFGCCVLGVLLAGGSATAPTSASAADPNCNGTISCDDIVYMVNHVFKGGPGPMTGCE